VARGLKVAVFATVLVLLAAVPVALAIDGLPTSSTTYNFAATGAQGAAGEWKNTTQTVSITATPSADAMVTAHLSLDNGATWMPTQSAVNTLTATFPFEVSAEGSHAIKFYASDSSHVATQTPVAPGFINIDKTDPKITTTGLATTSTQSAAAHWSNETTRTITLVATDTAPVIATSGVKEIWRHVGSASAVTSPTASVEFTLVKGVGGVAEGSNEVSYFARDWAGNAETTQTGYVNIDTVEPTTTPSPALAANETTGWFKAPVDVTLDWADVSSGVPDGDTTYRLDDGNLTIYGVPFTVSKEGSTKLTYQSVDRALNVEATQTAYVNIDTSIPTVSHSTAPSRASGWYNKNVTVTLTGVDAVSGIKETQYRMRKTPTEAWKTAVANKFIVLASDNKVETFEYRALDKAENAGLVGSLKLSMDSVKPRTYGKDARGTARRSMALKYKIKDNMSPKAQSVWIKVRASSGRTQSLTISGTKTINKWFSVSWKPKARGTYKYYVYAKDLAGNAQKAPVGWGKITVR
jgi:hypothetical protein